MGSPDLRLFTQDWGVDTAVSAPAVGAAPATLGLPPGATLAAEPEVRRLLGGQPGGSHTPG